MSESNVVTLSLPKDETTTDKLIKYVRERKTESLVLFGIDEDGVPFIVHTPHRTVPKLIVYLETIKKMLMDEIVTVDVNNVINYNEEADTQ
jgi:hypothetical protein